jgi:hypothetical protein
MSVTIGRLQLTVTVAERRAAGRMRPAPVDAPHPAERMLLRDRCIRAVNEERDRWAVETVYRWGRLL